MTKAKAANKVIYLNEFNIATRKTNKFIIELEELCERFSNDYHFNIEIKELK